MNGTQRYPSAKLSRRLGDKGDRFGPEASVGPVRLDKHFALKIPYRNRDLGPHLPHHDMGEGPRLSPHGVVVGVSGRDLVLDRMVRLQILAVLPAESQQAHSQSHAW